MLSTDLRLSSILLLLLSPWLVSAQSSGTEPSSAPIVFAGTSTAGMNDPTGPTNQPLSSPTRPQGEAPSPTSPTVGTPNSAFGGPTGDNFPGLQPTSVSFVASSPAVSSTSTATPPPPSSDGPHRTSLMITLPAVLGTACLLLIICLVIYFTRRRWARPSHENRHATPIGDDEIETWRGTSSGGLAPPPRVREKGLVRVPSTQRGSVAASEKPVEGYAAAVIPAMAFVPKKPPVLINIQKVPNRSSDSDSSVNPDNPFNSPTRHSSKLESSSGTLSVGQSERSSDSGMSAKRPLASHPERNRSTKRNDDGVSLDGHDADERSATPNSCQLPSRPGSFDFEIDFNTAPTSPKKIG